MSSNDPFLLGLLPRSAYLLSLAPIVASHICVPPLSYLAAVERIPDGVFQLFNLIYSLMPRELLSKRFVASMGLDYDPYDRSKPVFKSLCIQHLTYMCVHGTYSHLFNNLYGAFFSGGPTFEVLGSFHLYAVYVLGGVVSTLPSVLYDRNNGKISLLGSEMVKHVSGSLTVPERISKPIGEVVSKAGNFIASFFPSLYIGSSGAVFSLMGCSAVLSTHRLICNIDRYIRNKYSSSREFISDVIFSGAGVLQSVFLLMNELRLSDPKALISNENSYFSKFIKIYEVSGTNHVGHVQGFVFGACYGLTFGIVAPWILRRRQKSLLR